MAWTLMSLVEVCKHDDGVATCQTPWRGALMTQIEALMTGPVGRLGLFLLFHFDYINRVRHGVLPLETFI